MDVNVIRGDKMPHLKIVFDTNENVGEIFIYDTFVHRKTKKEAYLTQKEPIAKTQFFITEKGRKYVEIGVTDLWVSEDFRKKGFGKLVMQMIFALATFYDVPVTLCSVSQAIGFYKKVGMKILKKPDVFIWNPKKKRKP